MSKAQELAEKLSSFHNPWDKEAAAELRRLEADVIRLKAAWDAEVERAETLSKHAALTQQATRELLEALELMYACHADKSWISHGQQQEKIHAQANAAIQKHGGEA